MNVAVAKGGAPGHAPVRGVARLTALACLFGAFLSISGALDTEAAAQLPRLAYWLFIALVSGAALQCGHGLLRRGFAQIGEAPLRAAGFALLLLPLTLLAVLSCKLLFGGRPSVGGFTLLLPGMASILAALQLVLALFAGERDEAPAPSATPQMPPPAPGPFAEALPLPLRCAVIEALEAEDHYVRVHTAAGSALVRMRFRDALASLGDRPGLRPHRSWWVAEGAILALGKRNILLGCGIEVPVSRRARAQLGPAFRRTGP
ncbi:MAG TPA: LytTR family DNA-binding domain-containing protein [Allosphingosinicella sp.]|jgi:hypothetical protein